MVRARKYCKYCKNLLGSNKAIYCYLCGNKLDENTDHNNQPDIKEEIRQILKNHKLQPAEKNLKIYELVR
ncbi:MAG: hypothetical protein ACOC22_00615 [bacterium]